ncbi:hypothetical protein MASR2M17_24560 [Aminivibrio sp.]
MAEMMKNGISVNENTLEILDMCEFLKMDFSAYFGDYRPRRIRKCTRGFFKRSPRGRGTQFSALRIEKICRPVFTPALWSVMKDTRQAWLAEVSPEPGRGKEERSGPTHTRFITKGRN